MKKDEFERIRTLRQVVGYASKGKGLSSSVVSAFSDAGDSLEKDAIRRLLLGVPLEKALHRILSSSERGAWGLLRYIVSESRVNSIETCKRADRLSVYFERWAQLKRVRMMEQRVMEIRSYIICAVLGAVLSLFSSLFPIISSFQFPLGTLNSPSAAQLYFGFGLSLISAIYLGLYLSPRRAYLGPIFSSVAYLVVMTLTAPLTTVAWNFTVGG